ncbi:histidinol dehydrogenase [Candidatus Micrarchaeota archaeon]|nr:histidinol dehydrogenase [Candidatus Micrarchaeota archaeon]
MKNELPLVSKLSDVGIKKFLNRGSVSDEIKERVKEIINNVKERKLDAILEYTQKFDGVRIAKNEIKVTIREIEQAYSKITKEQLIAIRESVKRVKLFHLKQKRAIKDVTLKSKEGKTTLRWLPIQRVGIYAPAGKAPLPSSVLMAAIPAVIAGCKEIVLCSPPQKDGNIDPSILVVANECGVKDIYKIGGAQAIAAMAYGCELFDKVDIITGPGNIYTAYAKQLVVGEGLVKIDTLAGPSEVVIIADETANASFIASDMLAQAEHGINSSAICITTSERLVKDVKKELEAQFAILPNNESISIALENFSAILVANNMDDAISFVNTYAPEHLEIFTKNASVIAKRITNAGAVFIKTGEVFGDYGMSGSNHILPTGSAAKFSSGVSVYTFMKYQLVEQMTKIAQAQLAKTTATFARVEKLEAHARSAETRLKLGEKYEN